MLLAAAAVLACGRGVSSAATYTWNGATTSAFGYFSEPDNWQGDQAPPTNGAADLIFGSQNADGYIPTAEAPYSIDSLAFNSSALQYTLEGQALTIGAGGLTDSSAVAESVSNNVILSDDQTWTTATAPFTVSGTINLSGRILTAAIGSGTTMQFGNAISGAGTLASDGSGKLEVSGGGSLYQLQLFSGDVQVSTGPLTITSTNGFLLPSVDAQGGTLTISGGANFNASGGGTGVTAIRENAAVTVTGTGTQFQSGYIYVADIAGGNFTVQLGASASVEGYVVAGANSGCNGTVTVASGGSFFCQGYTALGLFSGAIGNASVDGSGSILTTADLFLGGAAPTQLGGTGIVTITNGGAVVAGATEFFSNTSSLTANGGTLTTGSLISYSTGWGSIAVTDPAGGVALTINGSSGSATYSGSISGTGSLLKTGASSQLLSGANTFTGTVFVTGGLLEMENGAAAAYQAGGGTLQLDFGNYGAATLEADAGSTVILNTPTVYGGILLGAGSFNTSSVARFQGTTISNGISITPAAGAKLVGVTSSGTITDSSGDNLAWTGGTNLDGTLIVNGATTLASWTSTGIVQINSGGIITNTGTNMILGGGSQTYVGPSNGSGGTLNLSGGASIQLNGGLLVNNGNINGGAVDVNFAGLATGIGTYSSVVVNPGGTYLPGLYGSGSPAANDSSTTAAIEPAASGATSTSSPITAAASALITVNGADTLTLAGGLTANGQTITKLGAGTLIVAPFTASALNVSAGTIKFSPSSSVLSVSSLSVAAGARLDLTSDAADVSNTSLAAISALAGLGYAGGAWTGSGINSSTAAGDTGHLTALGVIQNNQSGTPLYSASNPFHGVTPGTADVLVAYTYYGDANLDGKVDATDYSRIDNGYLNRLTGWFNGDFNYDGVVNGSDYTLIDNAYNMQGSQINSQIAASTDEIAVLAAVPEPSGVIVLLAGVALSRRRVHRDRVA